MPHLNLGSLWIFPFGGYFVSDQNIQITRMTVSLDAIDPSCGSPAGINVWLDWNGSTYFPGYVMNLPTGANFADSGRIAVNVSAGHSVILLVGFTSGCNVGASEGGYAFVNVDGVPWNNNNAEHAVRAFTRLRNVINTSTPKGTHEFATLLSIQQIRATTTGRRDSYSA